MPLDVLLEDILPQTSSLSTYAPRIRDLFVQLPIGGVELTCEVPQLECLTVVARPRGHFWAGRKTVENDARTQIVPPSNLHALRVLIVHELQAFPDIPYPQLTKLYIDNSRVSAPGVLLNVLKHCVRLERLVLVNVAFVWHGSGHEQRVVLLPRLQLCTLGMTEGGVHVGPMLRCLALPPTVALRISGSGTDMNEFAALTPFPTLPCLAGCTDLAVDYGASTGSPFDRSNRPTVTLYLSGPPGLGVGSLRMSLKLGVDGYDSDLSALINTVVPFAALERVTLRACQFNRHVVLFGDMLVRAVTPRMRILRFIDQTATWHKVRHVSRSVAYVLAAQNALRELEVWTAHPRALTGVVAEGALERLVYHPTVPAISAGKRLDNIAQVIEEVRARVPEVEVCEAALPSILGIDGLEDEYGFY